jgi:hypothetical protein
MSAFTFAIVFICMFLYAAVGLIVVAVGYVFDVTDFEKKVNPLQDIIGWLPTVILLAFWLPLLIIWYASKLFKPKKWRGYTQHSDRIDALVHRMRVDSNYECDWDNYGIPSPKEFRDKGTSSIRYNP